MNLSLKVKCKVYALNFKMAEAGEKLGIYESRRNSMKKNGIFALIVVNLAQIQINSPSCCDSTKRLKKQLSSVDLSFR